MIAYEASQSRLTPALEAIRQRTITPEVAQALARIFKAMADPTRMRLLHALAQSELPISDLARLIGISESAMSHQLSLLHALRIVRRRRAGRRVFYALDDEHIRHLIEQGVAHQTHQEAN